MNGNNMLKLATFDFYLAVMQMDGFEYLRQSCPSILTELLAYVARVSEHSAVINWKRSEAILDGSDLNGRRVKQRLYKNFL